MFKFAVAKRNYEENHETSRNVFKLYCFRQLTFILYFTSSLRIPQEDTGAPKKFSAAMGRVNAGPAPILRDINGPI